MDGTGFQFACLNDPRLATHALSPTPAWLWQADASRILWANPMGAAVFDADSPAAASHLSFDAEHPAAKQIARLAATLSQEGLPRLQRLRGFGGTLGNALICMCSRIALADNTPAVLVVATERAGKVLPLPERTHRLLAGLDFPAAVFSADGELIEAMPEAEARFGKARDLDALCAATLAREAMRDGKAVGEIDTGPITMLPLGAGNSVISLLLVFTAPAAKPAHEEEPVSSAPAAPDESAMEERSRRFPFRFVWQMDAANRFTLGTEDLARLIGPDATAVLDRPWAEIAEALGIDPQGQVAAALARRDTWSGIIVHWPVDDGGERLSMEISGLPVFDRERQFAGFRGFGICRDTDRLAALEARRARPVPEQQKPREPIDTQLASKVLPFPTMPTLSPGEHNAFQELARELGARLKKQAESRAAPLLDDFGAELAAPAPTPPQLPVPRNDARDSAQERSILDRLPIGILVYRLSNLIYANPAFLDWAGYPSLDALDEAGGLDSLFIETKDEPLSAENQKNGAKALTITTVNGSQPPADGRLFSVTWNDDTALVLMFNSQIAGNKRQSRAAELSLRRMEAENHELAAILDTASDGVLMLDRAGRVLSASRSTEALFGYDSADLTQLSLADLLAPESRTAVLGHLDRLARNGGPESLDVSCEAIARVRRGDLVPMFITMGRLVDGEKFCAVLRDITAWKRTEEELINAKREAEKATIAKSDFLAKFSHEIRTPLNAIIGFSVVMMDERFGPIGNERYRQYLKDIHTSGDELISLLNGLLDLSKIEAGKIELTFVNLDLNELVQQCVAAVQDKANGARIIMRTSLLAGLPPIVADARSVRQIALNLMANSIKFTGAGGQVIVSTALTDEHEVVLRVRDTGTGMDEKELQSALEPFGAIAATARRGADCSDLALPIAKALAQANHAHLRITSQPRDGTLVEVAFPAARVLAQ